MRMSRRAAINASGSAGVTVYTWTKSNVGYIYTEGMYNDITDEWEENTVTLDESDITSLGGTPGRYFTGPAGEEYTPVDGPCAGSYVGTVTSTNANAYPNGGTQGGYWYERMLDD